MLAALQLLDGVAHDRVARQHGLERGVGLERRLLLPAPRLQPGIGVDDAQRVALGLVGGLEAFLGLGLVADRLGDEAGMVVAEDRRRRARP